ncbi:acylamino-acid-releasing enzyme-like isoform X1 [Littorina saxatilis]|uniref:Prolyl endopeptidase n=1 Tax=Littorina saxatilis TaxID=31220 RepID=A0AAN9BBM3_9CAEN
MPTTGEGSEPKMPFVPKELTAEKVVEAYRRVAGQPAVASGTISSAGGTGQKPVQNIRTVWSQRDIDRKEKTHFSKVYTIQVDKGSDGDPIYSNISCSLPQEINNVLWDVESPSEKKRAVIIKQKDKKGEDKQFVEIWNVRQKVKTIDMKALDKHGDVVGNDGQFGSVQWSPCEEYLLYVAEKKKPKTASFFESKPLSDEEKEKGDSAQEATIKGDEYVFRETWGEQLVERHRTVVCRLCIKTSVVTVLTQVPDDISPGQALWGPENAVVFVGWSHEPYRLGLKFCVERKSFLYKATFEGEGCEKLSEEDCAVRCPSFSPDFSRLVYLDTPEGGPHNQCSRLLLIDWKKQPVKQGSSRVVVDIVQSPYKTDADKDKFPGLYTWADLGTQRNWLEDNVHVLLPSYWRSSSAVVVINTNTGDVSRLQPGACGWSCGLLDVKGYNVLLSCSLPDRPAVLMLGQVKPGKVKESKWTELGSDQEGVALCKLYDWQLFTLDPKTVQAAHPDCDYLKFEALLYLPVKVDKDDGRKPPLVLFPHGGPHSTFDCGFALNPTVLAYCGFAVLCVNFRGSLGFGQDGITSLLSHIGDFDVKDCKLAMDKVCGENLVDSKNVFVYGGSHGGFLSGHLIGQYPDTFKAASMRNPVTNLTSMFGTTDIQDWIFTEAGEKFDYKSQASENILARLWKASPVRYIDNVKTPVMLNIGLKDMRVPPSQGLEYYKMLKARGVSVRCLTYPDSNHSLAEVEVEADSLVNSILWFAQHISQ